MSLRRHRRQHEQLSEFERGRIIWVMEAGWLARQVARQIKRSDLTNLGGRTGKILRPSSVALKSKNQEINRLQLAVKLPWAIFFESVDILS
ncbi:hypothetical protein TNCV_3241971 [Trichonephila clavipes]|nr:hypothetical protein TNCV_3241971 [Trichonephila clavipes]